MVFAFQVLVWNVICGLLGAHVERRELRLDVRSITGGGGGTSGGAGTFGTIQNLLTGPPTTTTTTAAEAIEHSRKVAVAAAAAKTKYYELKMKNDFDERRLAQNASYEEVFAPRRLASPPWIMGRTAFGLQ
ncbi:hypothetical protein RI054_11g57350 [Pseudoscourfieldia marina]